MKKILLTVLLGYIVFHAPFRLIGLATETLFMHPGGSRIAQDNERFWDAIAIETKLIGMGWNVAYKRNLALDQQAAYGLTVPSDHTVTIDSDLHWTARATILAHEAGHTLQPIWMGRDQGECFAEGVAMLVMRDGLREHARYLAAVRWTCLGVFIAEHRAIYHAAALLQD